MPHPTRPGLPTAATALLLGALLLVSSGCLSPEPERAIRVTAASPTPTPAPPPATPTATPATPAPTPDASRVQQQLEAARAEILAAMEGFPGVWAFAAIDLDTGAVMTIHEDLVIYPASSGKIVVAIAVLRAVQRGEVSLPSIEADFEEMMIRSDDASTDRLNGLVSQAETNAVLTDSGVSAASQFRDSWRRATFTAPDLARVWAALLRDELLDEERITYLLEISGRVELPENFATFPPRFERPGYQYGQKPGYYITGDRDVYAAGGFVRPLDGSGQGFVAAFISRLPSGVEGGREQRQAVFPILVRYLLGEE